MIGIIDYGIGNLRSVQRAVEAVGGQVRLIKSVAQLSEVQGLILPGVGHFGDCCRALRASGLWAATKEWAVSGRSFFGICVGQQMLFEGSEEAPGVEGLGVFSGQVVRFAGGGLKVPQIGWNQVSKRQDIPMLRGIREGDFVYYVHSFYAVPEEKSLIALESEYGQSFTGALAKGNLFATQFHPEKSQQVGLQLWRNFVESISE
jgi:imidazole glycerol-phosphate synthase subunit HisH